MPAGRPPRFAWSPPAVRYAPSKQTAVKSRDRGAHRSVSCASSLAWPKSTMSSSRVRSFVRSFVPFERWGITTESSVGGGPFSVRSFDAGCLSRADARVVRFVRHSGGPSGRHVFRIAGPPPTPKMQVFAAVAPTHARAEVRTLAEIESRSRTSRQERGVKRSSRAKPRSDWLKRSRKCPFFPVCSGFAWVAAPSHPTHYE